jgi:hypothetical protein
MEEQDKIMALPLLLFPDGDTLVYIDPAPEDGPQCLPKPTVVHRIHSERLLATGSDYFKRRLEPRQQTRIRKQRGFANILPDGVKYFLDLTPPTLEEDAIISMTELSCPIEIRTWANSKHEWDLPHQCVGGIDETVMVEEVISPILDAWLAKEDHEDLNQNCHFEDEEDEEEGEGEGEEEEGEEEEEKEGDVDDEMVLKLPRTRQRPGLPVEYSAARHRDGIEQVLHVLEGLSVTLNTPCKLWTFFAIAKIFKVATVPAVSDLISSWFYMANNTRFIEIHPEIAYRVACGIESQTLCHNAFVGLVGDEALLYLIRAGQLQPVKAWEKHFSRSRAADSLDDSERQCVEYASKSFADDVVGCFLHLAGAEMTWLADILEFQKLTQHIQNSPADKPMVLVLIQQLKSYLRFKIYRALASVGDTWRSCDSVPPPHIQDDFMFRHCDLLQRIIGKKFWMGLMTLDFETSGVHDPQDHRSIVDVGSGLPAFRGQEAAQICPIPRVWLDQRVDKFNNTVILRENAATNPQALAAWRAGEKERWTFDLNRYCPVPFADTAISTPGNVPSTDTDALATLPFRPAAGSNDFAITNVCTHLPFRPAPPQKSLAISSSDVIEDEPGSITLNFRLEKPHNLKTFNLHEFFAHVSEYVCTYSGRLILPYHAYNIPLDATSTLPCLGENQFKYLPLWAGGNDDESGGVFTDHNIPPMDIGGFSAPGPAVHTGSGASTSCSFSEINPSDSMSTVFGASHHATYSHVSDLMSVNSAEFALHDHVESVNEVLGPTFDDVESFVLSSQTAGEDLRMNYDSDDVGTVVIDSADLLNDFDIDMEHHDSDEDPGTEDFELEYSSVPGITGA